MHKSGFGPRTAKLYEGEVVPATGKRLQGPLDPALPLGHLVPSGASHSTPQSCTALARKGSLLLSWRGCSSPWPCPGQRTAPGMRLSLANTATQHLPAGMSSPLLPRPAWDKILLLLWPSDLSQAPDTEQLCLPQQPPPGMSKHWHYSISQSNPKPQGFSARNPCAQPAVLHQPGTSSASGAQTPLDRFDLQCSAFCQTLALGLHHLQMLPMQAELRPDEELQQRTCDGYEDKEVKASLAKSWLQGCGRLQLRLGTHHVAQGVALEDVMAWWQRRVCEAGDSGDGPLSILSE